MITGRICEKCNKLSVFNGQVCVCPKCKDEFALDHGSSLNLDSEKDLKDFDEIKRGSPVRLSFKGEIGGKVRVIAAIDKKTGERHTISIMEIFGDA